jgi:hypothetical protein
MAGEPEAEGDNRRLNRLVAVTVVILSVFLAVSKVKDDNVVQAMQKAKQESVDAWAEYQAARIKLHVDENALGTLRLLETTGNVDKALAAKQVAEYEADIAKYQARSKETRTKAEALEAEYDRLNTIDDQFDLSEAFLAIAIAVAAVAALTEFYSLLVLSWVSGGIGVAFGLSGFLGWGLRPEFLVKLLS